MEECPREGRAGSRGLWCRPVHPGGVDLVGPGRCFAGVPTLQAVALHRRE